MHNLTRCNMNISEMLSIVVHYMFHYNIYVCFLWRAWKLHLLCTRSFSEWQLLPESPRHIINTYSMKVLTFCLALLISDRILTSPTYVNFIFKYVGGNIPRINTGRINARKCSCCDLKHQPNVDATRNLLYTF